jgi:hypothetical protein
MGDNEDRKSSLRACLEESNNPRMQNYMKILDTPGISAFEWIHRTQEELMDGVVYLEKLKDILALNMRELDAARISALNRASEKEKENEITINVDVPITESGIQAFMEEANALNGTPTPEVKKRKTKVKVAPTEGVKKEPRKKKVKGEENAIV